MAMTIRSSFSAGELDPALHERTTLEKYNSGLATARNVMVGKSGRLLSRAGRKFLVAAKVANRAIAVFSPPNSGILIELGHQYIRVFSIDEARSGVAVSSTPIYDVAHALVEADMPNVHFESTVNYWLYIFCEGNTPLRFNYNPGGGGGFSAAADLFALPETPTNGVITPSVAAAGPPATVVPTGHFVDYKITKVASSGTNVAGNVGGEESAALEMSGAGTMLLPIAVGQSQTVVARLQTGVASNNITEMRVYRRPAGGGAYGYIGSTSAITTSGGNIIGTFIDLGGAADYSHNPPEQVDNFVYRGGTDARVLVSKTGVIYQQRLLQIDSSLNAEKILASRPGFQNDYTRDFPLGSDSSLIFKSGTSGQADVLRMVDSDGLVVFTTVGVFLHTGALSPTNVGMIKKGSWVINDDVPPLTIPGGVLFIDKATNVVRDLKWSTESASYMGEELSIFSNHLFSGKVVKNWGFQEGEFPLLWIVMDDGTFVSLTYEANHEMKAWTRHDSTLPVENVCGTGVPEVTVFVVNKDGQRYIEYTVPRYVSGETLTADTEAAMGESIAFMDSMKTFKTLLNDSLAGADEMVLVPITAMDWEGTLTLTCGTSGIFTAGTYGAVGTVMRFFDEDGSSVDLTTVSRTSDNSIVVQPSSEFPSNWGSANPNIYKTLNVFTGLSHLDNEIPVVVSDGYVAMSPNNDKETYASAMVVAGSLTLPNSYRGAIVHIGRPIVADVETLDIDSVEQRPVLIESQTVNKIYLKVYKSRGLFVGNSIPESNFVENMVDVESMIIDYEELNEIIGNTYQKPQTSRIELSLPGDWQSHGRVALRQVDPIHFEILSIIPDTEDMRR